MTLTCPGCGAAVSMTLNGQCIECGDDAIVAMIEQLQPDGGEES